MAVAGLLAQYMSIKAQISYCELQDTRWEDASGKVDDCWDNESTTLTYKGVTYWDGKYGPNAQKYPQTLAATKYANAKVPKFDKEKLDEYTDLDMEYSTMVAMYDTLLDELNAQAEGVKSQTSTESQDNHMIS